MWDEMDVEPERRRAVVPPSSPSVPGSAAGDVDRLAAVRATDLLDAEAGESFDRLTALARRLTGAPLAFLTVVDDQRSYWLSRQGLPADGPVQNTVDESFCQYVLAGEPLIVADVTAHDRTRENPSVEGMGVRAWAGFPVHTPGGQVLGSFCVVDTEVHEWTPDDVAVLRDLAAIASREVALRAATAAAEVAGAAARAEAERASLLARIGGLLTAGSSPHRRVGGDRHPGRARSGRLRLRLHRRAGRQPPARRRPSPRRRRARRAVGVDRHRRPPRRARPVAPAGSPPPGSPS